MIATLLSIPGQCVYHQVQKAKTKNELAVVALALAIFSGTISYYYPVSYTFSTFSTFIVYAGQFYAAKKTFSPIPDLEINKILAISLSIIIGGKIAQKLRQSCFPLENTKRWYSITWKTPFHIVNNGLVLYFASFCLRELVDMTSLQKGIGFPGKLLYHHIHSHQNPQEVKVNLVASFVLSALTSYWIPLSYTFSSVIVIILCYGAFDPNKTDSSDSNVTISTSLYLFLLGSKVGSIIVNFHFPSKASWYSISQKTPFHIINNLMLIGLPVFAILSALANISDTRPLLPDLPYDPREIDNNNQEREFNALKTRIQSLSGFKLDPKIQSEDDIRAARYLLLVGIDWSRESMRKNLKTLNIMTHPDKNPGIDTGPFNYITEAGKVLDSIYTTQLQG